MEVTIPKPKWDSNLTNVILELEKLRTKMLIGEVPPYIFFQLKGIFQILETLGSARIEGNNTTLSEYVENIIEQSPSKDEQSREIHNLEKAIRFIEENTNPTTRISRAYFSEIHKIITNGLTVPPKGEGSKYRGELRKCDVKIQQSNHTPPPYTALTDYFDKFTEFINEEHSEQNHLLAIAVAHHRFTYIHPFDNGNGRMVRLLNYALLIKLGFQVRKGRILNPSSVFYTDRDKYYNMLGIADSLKDADVLNWCEYFLLGLKNEIEKIDNLLKGKYVHQKILKPTITFAKERGNITQLEFDILAYLISKKDMAIKSEELSRFGIENSKKKAKVMAKLRENKIVIPIKDGGRIYTINFVNSILLRGIVKMLQKIGFISEFLEKNE